MIPKPGDDAALVDLLVRVPGVGLDGGKALLDPFDPLFRASCGRISPDTGTDSAAEQLINRNTENLSLDVPQRLVDGAERRVDDDPTSVAVVEKHHLPMPFDGCGVVPHDVL